MEKILALYSLKTNELEHFLAIFLEKHKLSINSMEKILSTFSLNFSRANFFLAILAYRGLFIDITRTVSKISI